MDQLLHYINGASVVAVGWGFVSLLFGAFSHAAKTVPTKKRAEEGKASKVDALYLSIAAPGFSAFPGHNQPDRSLLGIDAVLALDQVGAVKDAGDHVAINFEVYRNLPVACLVGARHMALTGDKQKAREYLSTARTMMEAQGSSNDIAILDPVEIEKLIASDNAPITNVTDVGEIFDEVKRNPLRLMTILPRRMMWTGATFIVIGIVLGVIWIALGGEGSSGGLWGLS